MKRSRFESWPGHCVVFWNLVRTFRARMPYERGKDVLSVQQANIEKGGRYCVAVTANGASRRNGRFIPNVSIHKFPADPVTKNAWFKFVPRHRPHSSYRPPSVLYCSTHF